MNKKLRDFVKLENILDLFMICFLITFNIFFSIFIWMPSDLSPNQAIGFISLIFISIQITRIIKRNKLFALHENDGVDKNE